MALLIPAFGESRPVKPANGETFTLEELQRFVGGYIQHLWIPGNADKLVIFVNEDGKREQLPINHTATAIMISVLLPDDVIVGDAIICTLIEAGVTGADLEQ
jgi:hypothetical protein